MPPPSTAGPPPSRAETFERWRERLSLLPLPLRQALPQTYQGISPVLARQLAGQLLESPVDELNPSDWAVCISAGSSGWTALMHHNIA